MRLELATQNDFDAIIAFYDDVTERTPEMATYARWSKRKHPTIESIKVYINEGSMYDVAQPPYSPAPQYYGRPR